MSKKPQYDPEEIRYPDQTIVNRRWCRRWRNRISSMHVGHRQPRPAGCAGWAEAGPPRILYAMYEDNLTMTSPLRSPPPVWATCWAGTIPTATAPSTMRWSVWRRTSHALTPGGRPRQFGSVDGDPPAAYRYTEARLAKWPPRCCGTSTRKPSTGIPTSMRAGKNPGCSRPGSQTCWSTAHPASPSAWPPTSRRTISGDHPLRWRCWTIRKPTWRI